MTYSRKLDLFFFPWFSMDSEISMGILYRKYPKKKKRKYPVFSWLVLAVGLFGSNKYFILLIRLILPDIYSITCKGRFSKANLLSCDIFFYFFHWKSKKVLSRIILYYCLECSTWMESQKWQNDLCSFPRQTIQYHSNPSLYLTSNAEEAEVEPFYEDLQDLLELTPKKRCPCHYRGLECKNRKSRNTWSNRQIWPWSTEWSSLKINRVLPRERTSHSQHPLPRTQEKTLHMDITRWSTLKSDWLYSLQPKMEKLYRVSKNMIRIWLWLRSWTPYCQIQT